MMLINPPPNSAFFLFHQIVSNRGVGPKQSSTCACHERIFRNLRADGPEIPDAINSVSAAPPWRPAFIRGRRVLSQGTGFSDTSKVRLQDPPSPPLSLFSRLDLQEELSRRVDPDPAARRTGTDSQVFLRRRHLSHSERKTCNEACS